MIAIDNETGMIVESGDAVTDFRGDTGTFNYPTRVKQPGKSGKVVVDGREYYDKVFNLTVIETPEWARDNDITT